VPIQLGEPLVSWVLDPDLLHLTENGNLDARQFVAALTDLA